MDRATVRRYVRAGAFPGRAGSRRPSRVDRFTDNLRGRWHEGCRDAARLTREIRERGFRGSYYMVRRRLAHWRASPPGTDPARGPPASRNGGLANPSARRVSWWLLKDAGDLEAEESALVEVLRGQRPELSKATGLARELSDMIRHRRGQGWEGWLAGVQEPGVAAEMRTFAEGLRQDEAAVRAGLESPWSNGQVEGQVNRLKTIKRQMLGRAKFDLLRQRALYRGQRSECAPV
jgi:transposase